MKRVENKEKKRKAPVSPAKQKKNPKQGERKEGDKYYSKEVKRDA